MHVTTTMRQNFTHGVARKGEVITRADEVDEKLKTAYIVGGIAMVQQCQMSLVVPQNMNTELQKFSSSVHLNQACVYTTLYVNVHRTLIHIPDVEAASFHGLLVNAQIKCGESRQRDVTDDKRK